MFDDSLLDDHVAFEVRGDRLRHLALTGARLRWDPGEPLERIQESIGGNLPRAVLVVGAEARLVRAIVETSTTVPCVAWHMDSLPAWTGPLDLVVVLAGDSPGWVGAAREAAKRGAMVFVVAEVSSPYLEQAQGFPHIQMPEDDPFVAALFACKILDMLGLGVPLDLSAVADGLDEVCDLNGPRHSLESNPAKNLACALADSVPLVFGESILAARASRRVAEALREATGLPALAAGYSALLPVLQAGRPHDVFDDPFEGGGSFPRFSLLILDDGEESQRNSDLTSLAQAHGVRVETIKYAHTHPVVRYGGLLYQGLCAAGYLGLATMAE
jgi:hypothetical protein